MNTMKWTDQRIIRHLNLSFLAYLCEAHLTKALRDSYELLEEKSITKKTIKPRQLTEAQAMDELAQVMAVPVNIKKDTTGFGPISPVTRPASRRPSA
jgi:hypothetical protein